MPERSEQSILYQKPGRGQIQGPSRKRPACNIMAGVETPRFVIGTRTVIPDLMCSACRIKYYENERESASFEKTASHFPKTPWGAME